MKILIVDDHPVVRDGLSNLLSGSEPEIEVVLAGSFSEGVAVATMHGDLDAVLLDLNLPDLSGAEAVREFGQHCPALPLIVLSASEDARDVRSALGSGALGYVPKSASVNTLVSALKLVLSGEVYVPALLLDPDGTASAHAPALTERQIDVLRMLEQGLSNKHIARELAISEKTVKAHVGAILKFLNVDNRTHAVTAARKARLL